MLLLINIKGDLLPKAMRLYHSTENENYVFLHDVILFAHDQHEYPDKIETRH